jgi:6-phosphogluconolactonase
MNQKLFNNQGLNTILLLAIMFISFGCSAQKFYLFTGTYTNSGSKGIYVYTFNSSTGNTELVSNTDSVVNPSYLTVSKNGNYVYAVNETNGAVPGRVSAFSFDKKSGKLHFLNTHLSGGDDPCYVALNADGKWLAVANYSGGSAAIFPVNKNGSLQPYAQLIQDSVSSINKDRQEKAHVHETVFSPDNKYLFTPDLGMDKIMIYKFNSSAKRPLKPSLPPYVEVKAGSGPRHITFHPNKKFVYLINELSGFVVAYNYKDGKFSELQNISAHPEEFKGVIGSSEIDTSPDGKFLYVSNRGEENTITIFSINSVSGKLNLVGYQPTGKGPRHFMIDPTGKFLLVANQDSDNVVIFKRDKITGLLTATGEEIKVPKPVCLQMIPMD